MLVLLVREVLFLLQIVIYYELRPYCRDWRTSEVKLEGPRRDTFYFQYIALPFRQKAGDHASAYSSALSKCVCSSPKLPSKICRHLIATLEIRLFPFGAFQALTDVRYGADFDRDWCCRFGCYHNCNLWVRTIFFIIVCFFCKKYFLNEISSVIVQLF